MVVLFDHGQLNPQLENNKWKKLLFWNKNIAQYFPFSIDTSLEFIHYCMEVSHKNL